MHERIITIAFSQKQNELFKERFSAWNMIILPFMAFDMAKQTIFQDDVVLAAINAIHISEYEAQSNVRSIRKMSFIPIIVISPSVAKEKFLEDGADVCFSPDIGEKPLLAHMMAVVRRYLYYSNNQQAAPVENPHIIRLGDLEIDPPKRKVTQAGNEIWLPRMEYRLLMLFATNPGVVFEREEIGNKLWTAKGYQDQSITKIVSSLRRRLNDDSEHPRYIKTVHGSGYGFMID